MTEFLKNQYSKAKIKTSSSSCSLLIPLTTFLLSQSFRQLLSTCSFLVSLRKPNMTQLFHQFKSPNHAKPSKKPAHSKQSIFVNRYSGWIQSIPTSSEAFLLIQHQYINVSSLLSLSFFLVSGMFFSYQRANDDRGCLLLCITPSTRVHPKYICLNTVIEGILW